MDAATLLHEVSDAYRNLRFLALEASMITEQGDEYSNSRSERRARFFYAAPNRIRFEQFGRHGMLQIADGAEVHTVFERPGFAGGRRYTSVPVEKMPRLPHLFQPEFPSPGGGSPAFLFQSIDQRVANAEIVREEESCSVVSVSYEPPARAAMIVTGPVVFWINSGNRLVIRQQGDVGHRIPTEEEVTWTRHTVSVRDMRVNEPLADDTFLFTPPPDAELQAGRTCGISAGGGSGGMGHAPDGRQWENRSSHEWDGDTLIERSKWKIRGRTLEFERRLTFSEDEKELRVAERIISAEEEVKSDFRVRTGG